MSADPHAAPAERRRFGLERWQVNQYVVAFVVLVSFLGFDFSTPFFPLYIRELGDYTPAEAAFWAGLLAGIAPLLGGITGPFWGQLADRIGRKAMAGRSLVAMSISLFLMAYAADVWQLFAIRGVLGLFGGFVPVMMALALAGAPRERTGQIIGTMQFVQFVPLAVGPLVGGALADRFGLRVNFQLAAVLALLALIAMVVGYRAPTTAGPRGAGGSRAAPALSFRDVFRLPTVGAAMLVLFLAQYAERVFLPTLPVHMVLLDTPPDAVASLSGLGIAAGAVGVAVSGWVYGRLTGRFSARRLLSVAFAGGALLSIPLALVNDASAFIVLRGVTALVAGGAIGLAYTTAARAAPPERSATVLSVLGSVGMVSNAISPALSGALATLDLRTVFLLNAPIYLLGLLVVRIMWSRDRAPRV